MSVRELVMRLDRIEGKVGDDGPPLAVLHMPYAGDRGLGSEPHRSRCLVVHELGCGWPTWRCEGPPDCPSVPPVAELTDLQLEARISDLQYLERTHPREGWGDGDPGPDDAPAFRARMDELAALTGERAARSLSTEEGAEPRNAAPNSDKGAA
jgi:hypothetical protein